MSDVLCLGEILIDWISTVPGVELHQAEQFTKAAGGAPANTAVSLARQGIETAFLGRVATDQFGKWLREILINEHINTLGLIEDHLAQTRMAYIVTASSGERKVAGFTNIACADARLEPIDLKEDMFAKASVLHFGSISLIEKPAADATYQAIELAHKHQLLMSFDPNVRLDLWPSADQCRRSILNVLPSTHLVKLSENELDFLTGSKTIAAAQTIRQNYDIPLLIITLGARGAIVLHASGTKLIPGFQVEFVEDTGAGDGFNSGMIAALLPYAKKQAKPESNHASQKHMIESLSLDTLTTILHRANAVGALTCTRKGAIPALPYEQEIMTFLGHHQHYDEPLSSV